MFKFFFINDTATTQIYTLSLHDALPISDQRANHAADEGVQQILERERYAHSHADVLKRSEEHTSELQSHHDLVCRLLLEKKKNIVPTSPPTRIPQGKCRH